MARATASAETQSSIDPRETEKFARLAAEWWDPAGKFKPLHKFNPVRLQLIHERVARHFGRDGTQRRPFEGLRFLDIGCGGGLLSEPMARLGADVLGADATARNIEVAKLHAKDSGLEIDYRAVTAEALLADGESFDVVLNMEVVEHVADPDAFLVTCARLLRPGGLMVVATLNRTPKAFGLAIVGAEYILGWLPKGTHDWRKFVTPVEIRDALVGEGLEVEPPIGVSYNPLADRWATSRDISVNYLVLASRPPAQ